jgi:hypothetical protein
MLPLIDIFSKLNEIQERINTIHEELENEEN